MDSPHTFTLDLSFLEPTNMLDMKAIIWLENYLQVSSSFKLIMTFSAKLNRLFKIFLPEQDC